MIDSSCLLVNLVHLFSVKRARVVIIEITSHKYYFESKIHSVVNNLDCSDLFGIKKKGTNCFLTRKKKFTQPNLVAKSDHK